ncbi:MAG: hypothetical protein IPP96_00590 [Chitinophagaceae bacterium]|nr:hypothetical protein [Chitinophagaceae bacterium]
MPNRKHLILAFALLISSFHLTAQKKKNLEDMDLTGLWKGFMFNDTTRLNYRYEIAISESKGKLYGFTHTYFILNDKEYHGVKRIKIKKDGDELVAEDVELIANNYPIKPPKGVHVRNTLVFEMKDTVMILSGHFSTNRTKEYAPATGFIHVERKNDYSQSALIPHLQELGLAKELTFLTEENMKPAAATAKILKPVPVAEEEKIVEAAVKKQAEEVKKAVSAPAEKEPVVVKAETKTVEIPSAKTVTKPAETVAAKPAPQKPKEQVQVVVKTTEPAVKKTEPVVANNKPAPAKTETPVVKAETKPVPVKQPEKVDPTAATDLAKRKVETIQTLYFKSDSLELVLYDNGEVDGDTVSIIMNGTVIMPKVGLSTNAVKKMISTKDAGDSIKIIMYAESLGSLPPNTGLLIVNDGTDRYEIRFSGDLERNAAIVFRRRE